MKPRYYVYAHIRHDKNEVFYIGLGTRTDKELRQGHYFRSKTKRYRNTHWKNIVNKTSYEIEIVFESFTQEDSANKEVELILLYGRRDLGTGTLVNMTDGGEGLVNRIVSEATKKKISEAQKGKKVSQETRDQQKLSDCKRNHNRKGISLTEDIKRKMSEKLKGLNAGSKNPGARPCLDLQTGIEFDSLREACEALNRRYELEMERSRIRGGKPGLYRRFVYTEEVPHYDTPPRRVIEISTGLVFNSVKEACELLELDLRSIKDKLYKNRKNCPLKWENIDGLKHYKRGIIFSEISDINELYKRSSEVN